MRPTPPWRGPDRRVPPGARAGRDQLRSGLAAGLVLFDVDDLAGLNLTAGRDAADQLLDALDDRLRVLIRSTDSLERLEGGAFALVLPGARRLDALLVAERLRTTISRSPVAGRAITLSAGVAALPDDGVTGDAVEARAARALRWAKTHGRNQCAVSSEASTDPRDDAPADVLAHLRAVVASIDGQHLHTRDHSENVASYAVATCQRLGLPEEHAMRVRRAAFLHDIGKIAVDSAILMKPSSLTDAEFAQIQIHPVVGARMLYHGGLVEEARWVRHHHERIDGRGYPDRLDGSAIPVESRIIFVADAFEAMTSDRPYRRGMPVEAALEELECCGGSQFDPKVVGAFADLVRGGDVAVLAMLDGD